MLAAPRQVAVVPPLVAGGLFVGAGAALLWLQKRAQDRALEIYKKDRQFTGDAAYRRPDYRGMSSGDLKRATHFLNQWKEDFYRDPLTGVTIERNQIERELLRRSGQGGFIFIPPAPVVAAPVVAPALAQLLGWAAAAAGSAVALAQIWGFLKQRRPIATAPGAWFPTGPAKAAYGDNLRLCVEWNNSCSSSLFNEFISMRYDNGRLSYGVWIYDWYLTARFASGNVGEQKMAARSLEEMAAKKLVLKPGVPGVGTVEPPSAIAPGTFPDTEPEPAKLPPLITPVIPTTEPPDEPERTEPSVVPVEPGVKPLPAWPVLPWRPSAPAALPGSQPTQDGAVLPPVPDPIPNTPPNVVFPVPGGGPVGGTAQSPAPTLEGIAQETGRIEKKLEALLNPGNPLLQGKWDLFWKLIEFIMATQSGGQYVLREPCDPDGDGVFEERTVDFQGGYTVFGALMNRIDALAALEQAAKELRQPTCSLKPALLGEWVSVRFQSDEISPAGDTRLSKQFRYRDQTAAHQEVHVDHWKDFVWQAGGVCVISKGLSWGTPQVWAASADEGKRVISHAAAVAGVDLTDPKHEWVVTGSADGRYGQPGTMRVQTRSGLICVSKRSGPSGRPLLASPGSP